MNKFQIGTGQTSNLNWVTSIIIIIIKMNWTSFNWIDFKLELGDFHHDQDQVGTFQLDKSTCE